MTYCHECGSEVADIDVFCPYCGIILQKTIGDSDTAAENSEQQNADNGSPETSQEASSESANSLSLIPEPDTNYSQNKADADLEEAEEIELEFENNADVIDESFHEFPDAKSIFKPESADEKIEDARDEVLIDSPSESSMMDYEEAEVKEFNKPQETDAEPAKQKNDDELDLSSTIPYIPKDVSGFGYEEEDRNSSIADDSKPIEKPSEELSEAECPSPRFDSVKILESDSLGARPVSSQSAAVKLSKEQASVDQDSVAEKERVKEGRSFTTPNMGKSETDGNKSPKLKPLEEGTVLNARYEIVRKIGGGGMGAVYIASDKNLGGVLRAVKEMVQSYIEGEQQEKAVNDFKRESLLLTSLEHNAIPTIYDYFFDEGEGRFYLVMKYISGGDLAARLRASPEGRIDEKSVTEWAIQIADVLDYLHNRQPPIVYRDLKPANIMIDGNSGRVMLIDFGIARWVNKEERGVTAVGTMGYAPPELFSGNVEPRSDIYSLGSTMFHLLTGADPQSNPLLIFDFQKHPYPRQINPQLSDQMEKILMRAVEYNASKRFSSAADLRRELEKHLDNLKANKVTFGVKDVPANVSLKDQQVFCGFCGQKIVASDLYCAFCGAKQPLAQKGVRSEDYTSAVRTARLMIVGTNELETPAFDIEKDNNLVGRRDPMSNIFPEVDLSKYDPQTKISRRHARIFREGSKFLIEDLGSSNGTVVQPVYNETVRLMPHQPYVLTNGDKLRLGDTTLHFVIG